MGPTSMPDALSTFGTILKMEAKTDSQKKIAELAHMALARIFIDRGMYTAALDEYARIGLKSDLFNDALYESAWVNIKGKDYGAAARSLDLLMLNAPDSNHDPRGAICSSGSLHIRRKAVRRRRTRSPRRATAYEPIHLSLEEALSKIPRRAGLLSRSHQRRI